MLRICVAPGHINIVHNSIISLRSGTGCHGEQELNLRIANRLSEVLRSKGIEVVQTDANANDNLNITGFDFDLFIALHGDANVYGKGGGCITAPDPSLDENNVESVRISKAIEGVYFKEAGIDNVPSRINGNMTSYYMWQYLSDKTPCVILEMGVVEDAHDSVILADTERVVVAIAKGIYKAFSIPIDEPLPPTQPIDPCASQNVTIMNLEAFNNQLKNANKRMQDIINQQQDQIDSLKTKKKVLIDSIEEWIKNLGNK